MVEMNSDYATPAMVSVGANPTLLWGMTNAERVRRIAVARGLATDSATDGPAILANLAFAFDPASQFVDSNVSSRCFDSVR